MVCALRTLRHYIIYEEFTVHTDHSALRWLFTVEEPSGRLIRWRLRLAEFNFNIAYKKGTCNQQADALSRLHTLAETVHEDWDDIPSFILSDLSEESADPSSQPPKGRYKLAYANHQTLYGSTDKEEESDIADLPADKLFSIQHQRTSTDPIFTPINHEELATAQLSDPFCTEIRRKLDEGWPYPTGLMTRKSCVDRLMVNESWYPTR